MGTCECENNNNTTVNNKELKHFFTRKNAGVIKYESDKVRREKLKRIKVIKKFIIKNLSRLYKKETYQGLKLKAKNLFFEEEVLNFQHNKSSFEKKLNTQLADYFKGNENIVNDLFQYNLIGSLHSFPKIRDKISIYHNDIIVKNQKEYLNNFISFLKDNNLIKQNLLNAKQLNLSKMILKGSLNFEHLDTANFGKLLMKKTLNEDKHEQININNQNENNENKENSKNNNDDEKRIIKKESKVKFNLSWEQISKDNLIKKEIDNFYDVCFGSTKKNFIECQKKSIFLNILIFQEYKKIPKIKFTCKLQNLLKSLYYLYLLKKYNYLSDTNNYFYKINSLQVKKKSIIRDKILLNNRESFGRNELRIKLLRKAIIDNINDESFNTLESNIMDSMSSILSEEYEKGDNSMISADNDVKLLKSITNNVNYKLTKIKIEEEKNDNKSVFGKTNYDDIVTNAEKSSFHDMVQKMNKLKKNNNARTNKRTRTVKKNKVFEIPEYYNGQFDQTVYLFAGLGTLVNQNLNKLYFGTFRYGYKEGMGILYEIKEYNCIEYYMGEFHDNKINGYGIKIKINEKEFLYEEGLFESGEFIKGKLKKIKKKEERIITFNYEGEVKEDKFCGKGELLEKKYIFQEKERGYIIIQKVNYNGEFKNGKKNGKGKEIFNKIGENIKNYEYEGNFYNGLKEGYGIINYEKNNFVTKYEGFFVKDKAFQKYGIVYFKSGDIYEGFFENNLKNYTGLYSFYDSKNSKIIEHYFGGFLNDSKNGIGKTFVEEKEGKIFIGSYKRGEKEGQFVKIIFKNNEKIKKRRRGLNNNNLLIENANNNNKRDELLPKLELKSYPVYEENEIIDINDNFYFKNI